MNDRELENLYEKLKIQDKLKTQFLANISHEFRTPISLILSPIEQLLKETQSPELRQRLELAQKNARILLAHVNDLLDIAKLEAGKFTPYYTEIDLAKLTRHIAANFDRLAHQKSISYRLEAPDSLLAEVDVTKFRSVLTKLLSNAMKFTPQGGQVRCTLRQKEDRVLLEVADSGPGIAEKYRKDIFERFFQIEEGSVRRFGGIGLGLPIVRDLLELQGGSIDVQTAPEGGALLKINLPLHAPDELPVKAAGPTDYSVTTQEPDFHPAETPDSTDLETEKPLVLIVEDNADMNSLISDMLEPHYRTASALNGKVGLAKAIELRPDLILSDVMMPEMSGDQLFEEIKSHHPELKDIPFIVLTAKADDELRIKLLRSGADDYITKPFLSDEMIARIRNLLAVRQTSEKLRIELEARKRAERAVRESEERFRFLLEAGQSQAETMDYQERLQRTADAIVPAIADLCVIYVEQDGKIVPKAIAHSHVDELPFIWKLAQLRLELESTTGPVYVMRTGKSQLIENVTQELLEQTGFDTTVLERIKKFKVRSYMTVPLITRGRIIGIMSLVKRAPGAFSKKDLEFAEVIASRSALQIEHARLYQEANSSIRLREEILGIVSHDLKNPLSSVIMSNQLLEDARREMVPEDAALIHRPIEIIERSTRHMNRLIDDLLDFARIESGTLSLKPETVPAEKFVRDGIELIRHHSDRKRIHIQVTGPPRSPLVNCDPERITQVFYNLIGNAVKFSPSNSTIVVELAVTDSNLKVEIRDQGPGIPKESLESIFQKYWKVKTNSKNGTGLGLYIARKIVESHGGKLWAESVEGQGSKFIMTLPMVKNP